MGPSHPCEVRGLRPWVLDFREVYLRPRSRVPPDSVVGTTHFFVGKLLSVVVKRQFCERELLGFGGLGGAIAPLRVGLDGILIADGGRGGRAFADLRTGEVAFKETVDTTRSRRDTKGGGVPLERKAEGSLKATKRIRDHMEFGVTIQPA